jgi:hypothetical protein
MTATEAREKTLWKRLPSFVKECIEQEVNNKYVHLYRKVYKVEFFKSICPDVFNENVVLLLKELGYNAYFCQANMRNGEIDEILVIEW